MSLLVRLVRRKSCESKRQTGQDFLRGGLGRLLPLLALLALAWLSVAPAHALEAIVMGSDREVVDITLQGEQYEGRGDKLSIETAPSADGITGRMTVSAKTAGTAPKWVVFALNNPSDKQARRLLVAQRYDLTGSKVFLPNLDAARIANITPSLGFRPEKIENDAADVFALTLEPGATVTYIVELASADFPRLSLIGGSAWGQKTRDGMLFNGILLGIAGLLALFLTAIFAASHKLIFPATALVAWSAVAYLCVDFGFWHKLFQLNAEDNAIYRAAAEAAIAASLVIFLYSFLNLRLWHRWIAFAFLGWLAIQGIFVALSVVDAKLASGLARISYLPIAVAGSALIGMLAVRGQERAWSLLPTWMLFLVWLFGAAMAVQGRLAGDVVPPSLNAGLVLIVVLLGFTVLQYAFHTGDSVLSEDAGQFQLRVLALEASGAIIWEWSTRRNEITTGADLDTALGYQPGTMRGNIEEWLKHLHSADRERLRLMLWMLRERNGGEINSDFRLRRSDGTYLWYELRASSLPARHSRSSLRCVGLLRDVTQQKRVQERLLHNAIHDSLTGLPNRELFLDRLHCAITAGQHSGHRPTVLFIDIDTFRTQHTDLAVSDGVLFTAARRLSRHLGPLDTLARVSTEQFAVLLAVENEARQIAMLADSIRRSLRSPIKAGGKDIVITGSIGISVFDGHQSSPDALLREAETAMYRAKRSGADRIELFKTEMRGEKDDRTLMQAELRQAIERRQIRIFYQPIMRLSDRELGGMEVLIRWEHPKLGRLSLPEFLPLAEDLGMVGELTAYVLDRSVRQAVRWQRTLQRTENPVFISINLSGRHFFKPEIIQDLRLIIGRETAPKGCLMIEVNESLIMENPEQAIETLNLFKGLGASLCLDNFGASYSSLTYLHRLPFDMIKIDRQLLSQDQGDRAGAVVFKSVVNMARELDKDVIAAGVEREDEDSYVKAVGCDYALGFFYGEPMSEKEVMSLIQAMAKSSARANRKERKRSRDLPPPAEALESAEMPDDPSAMLPATEQDYSIPVLKDDLPVIDRVPPPPLPPTPHDEGHMAVERLYQASFHADLPPDADPDWHQSSGGPSLQNIARQAPAGHSPLPDIERAAPGPVRSGGQRRR